MINETVDFVNINTGSYGHAPGKPFNTTSTTIEIATNNATDSVAYLYTYNIIYI